MKKGNKYEFNTAQGLQYILEVLDVDNETVFFKGHDKDIPSVTFEVESTIEIVNEKIKRNEIGLIK